MNDYNIEFAHIYADQKFSEEQAESCKWYKVITSGLNDKKVCSVVLVDNYNAPKYASPKDLASQLDQQGTPPDFVAFERDLIKFAEDLFEILPKPKILDCHGKTFLIGKDEKILIKKSRRYSCSMLIASWILLRLGQYTFPLTRLGKKTFPAKFIITILPKKYMNVELKAREILNLTPFKSLLGRVHYFFF